MHSSTRNPVPELHWGAALRNISLAIYQLPPLNISRAGGRGAARAIARICGNSVNYVSYFCVPARGATPHPSTGTSSPTCLHPCSRAALPRALPVDTPVRYGIYPCVATVIQGWIASGEGISTGNARSLTVLAAADGTPADGDELPGRTLKLVHLRQPAVSQTCPREYTRNTLCK